MNRTKNGTCADVCFEVLGPLRTSRAGTPLILGRVQQRVVLALLLIRTGRPFPRDQLIDAVWGEAAPTYAVNLLQKNISGLRSVLEGESSSRGPARLLSWSDAGYVLHVPDGGLDLRDFDRQVARGRVAKASGELALASGSLHAALDLYRGPLCEGLHSPVLDAERARLEERWLGVLEDQVDVDLQLGTDPDYVTELRRLVNDYPLRERFRASLMLALHRGGRTAEALLAYSETRRHLRDQLGLDPSPETQRLHEQILAGDPSLTVNRREAAASLATTKEPSKPVVPAQLPHRVRDFTGRTRELRRLDTLLDVYSSGDESGTLILSIAGSAGVGKTALAIAWAQMIKSDFPDGQLYVNLRGFDEIATPVDSGEAVRGFLEALGVPASQLPAGIEGQFGLFRTLLTERRMLILLDNARDSRQVRPLLPGSAHCVVIATSRHDLTGLVASDGAVPVPLGLLTGEEAREYMTRRIGSDRVRADPVAIADLIELSAHLPLALAIVAARAATRPRVPLIDLTAGIRDATHSLDAFSDMDESADLRQVFSWSVAGLTPSAARLFRLLGLHPDPHFGVWAARALSGTPLVEVRRDLDELAHGHLIEDLSSDRFSIHDLLRDYARELIDVAKNVEEQELARTRIFDFYGGTALCGDRLLEPNRSPDFWLAQPTVVTPPLVSARDALAWFQTEHTCLMLALEEGRRAHRDLTTVTLAWGLYTYLTRTGRWDDFDLASRAALDSAKGLGDQRAEGHAERALASACVWRGEFTRARAHFARAAELFESAGELDDKALLHLTQGWALDRQGDMGAALTETERALALYRIAGQRSSGLADTLNAVGWFHAQLGDAAGALPFCQEALALQDEIGNIQGAAHTWDSLGLIHHRLGDTDSSIRCYHEAIERWVNIADRHCEAATLVRLGEASMPEHASEAQKAWTRAVKIYNDLGLTESSQQLRMRSMPRTKATATPALCESSDMLLTRPAVIDTL